MKKITFRFKEGDRVWYQGNKYIIGGQYYPDGYKNVTRAGYTIYPPGKKKDYKHHFWIWDSGDLRTR